MNNRIRPPRINPVEEAPVPEPEAQPAAIPQAEVAARESAPLHGARAESGKVVLDTHPLKVYHMTSGDPDPNSDQAHWPITSPIPSDPDKATEYWKNRQESAAPKRSRQVM